MIDNLLMCDPRDVTPQRAGAAFSQCVRQMCKDEGRTYTECWNKAKTMHPELFARMCNEDQDQAATVEAPAQSPFIPYAQKAFILSKFCLPNLSDALFAKVYNANGAQYATVNAANIFQALVVDAALTQSVSVEIARRLIQEACPKLAEMAGEGLGGR